MTSDIHDCLINLANLVEFYKNSPDAKSIVPAIETNPRLETKEILLDKNAENLIEEDEKWIFKEVKKQGLLRDGWIFYSYKKSQEKYNVILKRWVYKK